VILEGAGEMAVVSLFAAVFEPSVSELHLRRLPASLAQGGSYPNLLRYMDLPQALALVLPRPIFIRDSDPAEWSWTAGVATIVGGSILFPE
jgi:hypothetical protein